MLLRALPELAPQGMRGSGWAYEDNAYSLDVMVNLARLDSVLDYVTDPEAGAFLPAAAPDGRSLVHVEGGMKRDLLFSLAKIGIGRSRGCPDTRA